MFAITKRPKNLVSPEEQHNYKAYFSFYFCSEGICLQARLPRIPIPMAVKIEQIEQAFPMDNLQNIGLNNEGSTRTLATREDAARGWGALPLALGQAGVARLDGSLVLGHPVLGRLQDRKNTKGHH